MKNIKKFSILVLCLALTLSLTGCKDKAVSKYQNYVKSLIALNYLGATDDYIKSTGANKEDAQALYDSNVNLLARNILTYYNITISDSPELDDKFLNLAKTIYSKVNYNVSKARKDGSVYLVDVTIYPIDLFNQAAPEVTKYVEKFNKGVSKGDYNDYTMDEYENEFASGMLDILTDASLNMTYTDPVTVTVEIIADGETYYISDRDFLRIDAAMFSTDVTSVVSTETDAEEEQN